MRTILLLATCLLLMSDCPVVTISQPVSGCVGQEMTFTANVTGGTAPYSYTWYGCVIGSDVYVDTSDVHEVNIGTACTYTVGVTVTDAAGCSVWKSANTVIVNDCDK